jgi:hypothetical protein
LFVDQTKSIGKSLDDNVHTFYEDVDPDVLVDVNPDIIEREAKILQASKHVIMARAQQKHFQQEMKQTREDLASKDINDMIEQSQRSHVFVGDYCQKLELPSFCTLQPGDTYYLLWLTLNCSGAVDCSDEKDHMFTYVYHVRGRIFWWKHCGVSSIGDFEKERLDQPQQST